MEAHEMEFRLARLEKRMDKIEAKEEETLQKFYELDKTQGLIIQKLDSLLETVETIKRLRGLIDIYLVDLKYASDDLASKYSKAPNYVKNNQAVIKEMVSQQPKNIFENGLMKNKIQNAGFVYAKKSMEIDNDKAY